jgi:hypothetical protein
MFCAGGETQTCLERETPSLPSMSQQKCQNFVAIMVSELLSVNVTAWLVISSLAVGLGSFT